MHYIFAEKHSPEKLSVMKMKFALLTSILMLFAFTQCEKETNVDLTSNNNSVNLKLINEVIKLSSPSDQRLAYNLLSPAEKTTLWKQKFTELIKSDTLTDEQRNHIEKLNLFINSSTFEDSNKDSKSYTSFAKNWCIEALNYFTKEEIVKIAFNVNSNNSKNNIAKSASVSPSYVDPGVKTCNCCSTSAWSCGSCSTSIDCTEIKDCGFLWNSTCDGRCTSTT